MKKKRRRRMIRSRRTWPTRTSQNHPWFRLTSKAFVHTFTENLLTHKTISIHLCLRVLILKSVWAAKKCWLAYCCCCCRCCGVCCCCCLTDAQPCVYISSQTLNTNRDNGSLFRMLEGYVRSRRTRTHAFQFQTFLVDTRALRHELRAKFKVD